MFSKVIVCIKVLLSSRCDNNVYTKQYDTHSTTCTSDAPSPAGSLRSSTCSSITLAVGATKPAN